VTKTVAVLCAVLFALTACGGGDGETARDNLKESLLDQGTGVPGVDVTEEQAGCVSDGMVDEIGVEKLQEYKLLDDELKVLKDAPMNDWAPEDAEVLAGVFVDCIDVDAMLEERFASGAGAQLTDEQRACLTDAVDPAVMERVLADTFQGKGADTQGHVQDDIMACITGGTTGGEGMELPDEEQ
jgi:hypothetical protein